MRMSEYGVGGRVGEEEGDVMTVERRENEQAHASGGAAVLLILEAGRQGLLEERVLTCTCMYSM